MSRVCSPPLSTVTVVNEPVCGLGPLYGLGCFMTEQSTQCPPLFKMASYRLGNGLTRDALCVGESRCFNIVHYGKQKRPS